MYLNIKYHISYFNMKYQILFFSSLIFTALLLGSCGRKTTTEISVTPPKIEKETEKPEIEKPETGAIKTIDRGPFMLVGMTKEGCYGKCPNYSLRLYSNGIAYYEGRANVQRIGRYHANVDLMVIEKILTFAKKNNLTALGSMYPTNGKPVPGIPATLLNISINHDASKEIKNYHHAPKALMQYQKMVEELVETADWQHSYE